MKMETKYYFSFLILAYQIGMATGRVAPIPTPPHLLKQFPSPIPAPPCLAFLFYFLFF